MKEDKLLQVDENITKNNRCDSNSHGKSQSSSVNTNYMRKIYKSLSKDNYNPKITVEIIENYLKDNKDNMRLMYSELSNHLFSIFKNESAESDYNFNISKLHEHVMKNNVNSDCVKIVIKILDHSQLVSYQIAGIKERANEIATKVAKDISEENKKILMASVKDSEKQYITILGIFASIVLAFTGGIAFSTSVLSNIDKASIYRLVFVTSLLGFILFNTICVMFEFVREINGKSLSLTFKNIFKKPLWSIPNIVFIVIMIISTLSYYYGGL